ARAWFAAHASPTPTASPSGAPSAGSASAQPVPDVASEIREAVALARKGAPIPPSIDPEALETDSWQVEYGKCYAGYGTTAIPSCELGDPDADRTLAVVGDSHAGMWLPAFDALGKQRHLKVVPVVKLGCAAYAVQQFSRKVSNAECGAFRKATTQRLQRLRPDGVVVTARGELFMRRVNGRTVEQQWHDAVRSEVQALSAVSPRVSVVGDVPAIGLQPRTCLSAQDADERSCMRSPASREADSNAVTKQAVTGTKARYVDVQGLVCAPRRCPLVVGDKVTYFDDSHLTRSWVEHVTPKLGEQLGALAR
ncbi:MAG: acyltransferase, partial [Nocardioides sp.]|nr:acyltransferase [Nocardioides sp.]